ncbi:MULTISPECIES: NAD(P)/FAD-dependent oxidoreductase [unclassified Prochlorococcus]|uniref:NAD(P)/FAD-dependent oxidoreductase n=1 Tax=unclassified Prochlorococcus TaxID=2627481 RepID=UPI00053382DB|nr:MULTISPECIES: FAD-dependent oxidoreductase [unclassified Prochlorococcus]KGG16859.1 NADH dehydrogenase [Prochlorococcus sp. MIT 0602]KGG18167.1 NADH dehydrogenase [Prochlorococcus sp. MIT 0603]
MKSNSLKSNAVVVVGGGFGGLTTALSLSSCKGRPTIILIEPRSRFVFLPLLYELLSGEMKAWEVAPSYSSLLASRGIVLIKQRIANIDLEGEVVITSLGQVIKYSQLVISTGSKVDHFSIPGVEEHCLMFNKYEDVIKIKKLVEALNRSTESKDNIVIVGGGATGVELACKLSDLLHGNHTVHLIELDEKVLPNGKSFNQEQIQQALNKRSIKLHLNTRVVKITEHVVEIENANENYSKQSDSLTYAGVIWTAGVKASAPDGLASSLLKDGRLLINSKLQVLGYDNVFSIGDVSFDIRQPLIGTAQVAMQQGDHLAKNLIAYHQGKELTSFNFVDRGEMLSMGIGEATITSMGFTLSGPLAFQVRRMAYLSKFPNLSLGIRSAGSWLLSYRNKFI